MFGSIRICSLLYLVIIESENISRTPGSYPKDSSLFLPKNPDKKTAIPEVSLSSER